MMNETALRRKTAGVFVRMWPAATISLDTGRVIPLGFGARVMSEEDLATIELPATEENLCQLVILMRGTVLHSYSQVEFAITDLIARCIYHRPEFYKAEQENVPYRMKSRLSALRRLLLMNGPIQRFGDEALPLVDRLLEFEQTRHLMAHGLMLMQYNAFDPNKSELTFQKYEPELNRLRLDRLNCTPASLSEKCREIVRYSDSFLTLKFRVISETEMPQIPIVFS